MCSWIRIYIAIRAGFSDKSIHKHIQKYIYIYIYINIGFVGGFEDIDVLIMCVIVCIGVERVAYM